MTSNVVGNLRIWGVFLGTVRWTKGRPRTAKIISEKSGIPIASIYRLLRAAKELELMKVVDYLDKMGLQKRSNMWSITDKGILFTRGFLEAGIMDIKEV